MEEKVCSWCNENKPLDSFSFRKELGKYRSNCKSCKQAAVNKEVKAENNRKRREDIQKILREAKDVPCADCGIKYHYCIMDFDHLPEFTKEFNVSQAYMLGKGVENTLAEVAKCEVVCSNCHRMRTWCRKNKIV